MNPILQQMSQQLPQPPLNDPLLSMVQMFNSGRNPMPMIEQMAKQDPYMAQAYQLMQGKNPQQLQAMAQNMAKERGIDLNEMIRQLGINNASRR